MTVQDDSPEPAGTYFTLEAGAYRPGELTRGPWAPNTINGRMMGGLAMHVLEQEQAEPGFQVARLTIDLFKAIPYAPLTVTTDLVRKGGRIRVADAEIRADGEIVARVAAVYLRPSTEPAGQVWAAEREWDEPAPDPSVPNPFTPSAVLVDMRPAYGARPAPGRAERRRVWVRDTHQLVAGIPLTPLVRVALVADAASPVVNHGTEGLQFINTDVALHLVRPPVGVFFGLEALDRTSAAGIAVSQVTLYDEAGMLGFCSVTALANPGRLRSYQPGPDQPAPPASPWRSAGPGAAGAAAPADQRSVDDD